MFIRSPGELLTAGFTVWQSTCRQVWQLDDGDEDDALPREFLGGACVDQKRFQGFVTHLGRQNLPMPRAMPHLRIRGVLLLALTGLTAQASKHDPGSIETAGGCKPKPPARRSPRRGLDPDARGSLDQPHGASACGRWGPDSAGGWVGLPYGWNSRTTRKKASNTRHKAGCHTETGVRVRRCGKTT